MARPVSGHGGGHIDAHYKQHADEMRQTSPQLREADSRHERHIPGAAALLRALAAVVVLFVVLQVYSWFRKTFFVPPSSLGFEHAREIIRLQRWLGIGVDRVEIPLQQHVIAHPWLIDLFNHYYQQMKIVVLASAALCVALTPAAFWRVARVFALTTLIAFPMYAIYPLAPPRLMHEHGYAFVDTLAVYAGVQSSAAGAGGANQFAAMPSMHIGWTTIAALWMAAAIPWRQLGAWLGAVHLLLMSLAVMATGNHYLLDIVAGLAVVSVALGIDWVLFHRRNGSVVQMMTSPRTVAYGPAR